MQKFERQNIKRRCGTDYKTYTNLLQLQENRCYVCDDQVNPHNRLVAAGRTEFPVGGQLVCRRCKHVVDAIRKMPHHLDKLLECTKTPKNHKVSQGAPYISKLYAERKENVGKLG